MKKKATLLIRHIERIYTMSPDVSSWIAHGYIAVHHDRILAIHQGDGREYVDKDTRIVEGGSHIACPGFIDVTMGNLMKDVDIPQLYERSARLLKHGTTIVNCQADTDEKMQSLFASPATIDCMHRKLKRGYAIVTPFQNERKQVRLFCIGTRYPQFDCLDQLLCAKWYALRHPDADPLRILAACTLFPAQCLSLRDAGVLKIGAKANILLMEGACISQVLYRLHGDESMQVIKDGVRLYPTLLI